MSEKIEYPDYYWIKEKCKEEIDNHFKEYGNSWLKITSPTWWYKRVLDQVKRFQEQKEDEEIKQLLHIVNLCCMRITNLRKNEDNS